MASGQQWVLVEMVQAFYEVNMQYYYFFLPERKFCTRLVSYSYLIFYSEVLNGGEGNKLMFSYFHNLERFQEVLLKMYGVIVGETAQWAY